RLDPLPPAVSVKARGAWRRWNPCPYGNGRFGALGNNNSKYFVATGMILVKGMLKPTIFREYDIRGVADTELLSPDIVDLGRALGTLLQRKSGKRINLGRDCRLSSNRL